ncbi:sulfite exporter TauE/SafE family protein [Patiriisocius hiemis]|uniref:Sulfite exporter TauE/SafE family protein n=1 Tax=Patiriisocius hiemis TaxID=3075604 RepID=A0ABU2YCL7_9FLAO|nr:sulfite exporter TauE/SafE family protein [Constantimarinum sp. W242]MDT0555920.1 sulfite exporter TauE/SafE family protein [Constantimarinum sp. W242]
MIWSAILFGLLGSLHCVGMCGPIAFLLPLDRKSPIKRLFQLVSYHAGRLVTYALLGAVVGLAGMSLNLFGFQQQLSIIIGILMIVVVLVPVKMFNRYNFSRPIYMAVGKVKSALGAELKKKDTGTFFTIGFLNGLLPCGLVYMAIFGALSSGGAGHGAMYMALFGMGTVPLMTTAVYMGNFLKAGIRQKVINVIPVFVIIIGMLFILRGMGLGIKFISPPETVAIEKVTSKHSCH